MTLDRKQFLLGLGGAFGALAAGAPARLGADEDGAPWPPTASNDGGFWRQVRAQYAIADDPVYLNTGGLGPSPRPVLAIHDLTARGLQHRVETGHFFFEEARGIVAGFLGADPEELCFVRNATEGNSIISAGLALQAGDEVIFESHAHPGGSLPWVNQARQRGVIVRTFEPDPASAAGNVERVAALLSPRTKVVQVSHITAPTGVVMPVAALARLLQPRGIWLHVDAAQSTGQIPINLAELGCDSFATSGHKWLGGPRETGVLFIRRARNEEVAPLHVGAYSSGDFDFQGQLHYTAGARRHEYGTRNAAAVVALAEAARFHLAIGRERVAAHGAALVAQVRTGLDGCRGVTVLTPAPAGLSASMITVQFDRLDAGVAFGRLLERHRLRCRPVTEAGLQAVRVSFHLFNTPDEAARVTAGIRDVAATA